MPKNKLVKLLILNAVLCLIIGLLIGTLINMSKDDPAITVQTDELNAPEIDIPE